MCACVRVCVRAWVCIMYNDHEIQHLIKKPKMLLTVEIQENSYSKEAEIFLKIILSVENI